MTVQEIQQKLISQIKNVDDKDILKMLDDELSYSLENREAMKGLLSEPDLKELKMLADEPIEQNTISLQEFNAIMDQWRMK